MAISAATYSVDRIIRSKANNGKSMFEDGKSVCNSSSTWYQGDLICRDATSGCLRVIAATTDAATLVGIADNQVSSGKLYSPYNGLTYVDAAQVSPGFVGPKYGVVASMKLNTGDTLIPGQKVYSCDATDTQTVTATVAGSSVGIYVGSGVTSAPAGTLVPVLIQANYPQADQG